MSNLVIFYKVVENGIDMKLWFAQIINCDFLNNLINLFESGHQNWVCYGSLKKEKLGKYLATWEVTNKYFQNPFVCHRDVHKKRLGSKQKWSYISLG